MLARANANELPTKRIAKFKSFVHCSTDVLEALVENHEQWWHYLSLDLLSERATQLIYYKQLQLLRKQAPPYPFPLRSMRQVGTSTINTFSFEHLTIDTYNKSRCG
jgi:hypothetical protein